MFFVLMKHFFAITAIRQPSRCRKVHAVEQAWTIPQVTHIRQGFLQMVFFNMQKAKKTTENPCTKWENS